jgi:hypothetical protein
MIKGENYWISDGHVVDVGTLGPHDSGSLMPQDQRWFRHEALRSRQEVGVTETGASDLDEHFVWTGICELDVLDGERAAPLAQHCTLDSHRFSSIDRAYGQL